MKNKKILVVTPKFPFTLSGACEQERSYGIKRLVELGYEVCVITKSRVKDLEMKDVAEEFSGAKVIPILYSQYQTYTRKQRFVRIFKRLINPLYWDGATFEYTDPLLHQEIRNQIQSFKPDIAWCDYTYLWPIYRIFKKAKIPIITRSINFEPSHFLQEDGKSFFNYIKYIIKCCNEFLSVRMSDFVFAITPAEKKIYENMRMKNCDVLPLRSLPTKLSKQYIPQHTESYNLLFTGSTYNVSHNKSALLFIIDDVLPLLQKQKFLKQPTIHITGAKLPKDIERRLGLVGVVYHGYVPHEEMDTFMNNMDVALIPSLYGAGMQQKIFEPLCRGLPTVTSVRGIAGYSFVSGVHFLNANSAQEYVESIKVLEDKATRNRISEASRLQALQLFSQEKIDSILLDVFKKVLSDV